ncbi:MAG TPA: thioesterase family protein [Paenibacillus sp.]|uniref:acyl-CoA thioesterase n=1 Tax=Paenibacillus sp. TaxID=58172 RepID=UPI0028D03DA5|nr:thioesterase family protein [Paenibacillus sp.]HUC92691.1 thioesterase family protein [Paenibacillus sp.]
MASHWHVHPLRVRYQETDRMAVVYHINYMNWFEIGRSEFIRHAGVAYKDIEARGLLLPVTELQASFGKPARYDDLVVVCTRIGELSAVRLSFESQIRRVTDDERWPATAADESGLPGEVLVRGGTKHVWLNREWRPVRLNKADPELFALLEKLHPDHA